MSGIRKNRTGLDPLVVGAFFTSGVAALVFEVVWFHRCALVFGETAWAATIVFSSFMGGLAVGSAAFAWCGGGVRNSLRAYAALEVTVAISGLLLTYLFPQLPRILAPITRHISGSSHLINVVRAVGAFTLFLVPATAIGATLPALVEGLFQAERSFGGVLGRLYGWNTLGSVIGVVVAEVALVPRVGVVGTAWTAAVLNLCAAALAASRISSQQAVPRRRLPFSSATHGATVRQLWRPLVVAALSGSVLLALEVTWFRFLALFVFSRDLAFSLMLAVVLAAVGLGGLAAAAWVERDRLASRHAAAVALIMACTVTWSYSLFRFALHVDWTSDWWLVLKYAGCLTFATSFVSGLFFTLLGDGIERDARADWRSIGLLLVANTIGAAAGPIGATFVLVPFFGMERALFVLFALYCIVAALIVPWSRPDFRKTFDAKLIFVLLVTIVTGGAFPFGVMSDVYFVRAGRKYATDGSKTIAVREGVTGTVFLMRQYWLGKRVYDRLVTNGFSMSGTHLTGARYMRLFAYLPALLQGSRPLRHALVICYGVGTTAAATLELPTIDSLEIAEISPEIVSLSGIIYSDGDSPLANRRARLFLEDGRQLLQSTTEKFDFITSEPPPPLTPGATNLYTREYFALVRDRLSQGGIATHWVPIARDGEYDAAPIIRAFCDVFSDCSLWNGTPFDWLLVGSSNGSGPARVDALTALWQDDAVGAHLREIGFESGQQVLATFLGDAPYLNQLTDVTPPLTDDFPRRLVSGTRKPIMADQRNTDRSSTFAGVIDTSRARQLFGSSSWIKHLFSTAEVTSVGPWFDVQSIVNRIMFEGASPQRHIEELDYLLEHTTLRRAPLWALGSSDALQQIVNETTGMNGTIAYELGLRALATRNYSAAASYLANAEEAGVLPNVSHGLRAYALCLSGQLETASEIVRREVSTNTPDRQFWLWLIARFDLQHVRSSE